MNEPPFSMDAGAIAINEMVVSLTKAGFSREEAIRLCAIWLAESGRKMESGPDDKGE